jgi:hypothetical protein
LLQLLKLTPGVQNSGDANTELYVRGGDAGQNLLLYDEVPIYAPGHLLGIFPLFNAEHLAALELQKSGIAARYGGRTGPVIDVRPKHRLPERASLRGSVGLLSSQATVETPLGKRFGLIASGRKSYTGLLLDPLLTATVNRQADMELQSLAYDFYDANLTLLGELTERDRLTVNAFLGSDRLTMDDADLLLTGDMRWQNALVSLRWERQTGNSLGTRQIYWNRTHHHLSSDQAAMNLQVQSTVEEAGYKSRHRFELHGLPVELGAQYAFHRIRPQAYNGRAEAIDAHEAALYGHTQFVIFSRLRAELGLRLNAFAGDRAFFSLEPRLALSYRWKDEQLFRLAYTRQNQYLHRLTPTSIGFPLEFWVPASRALPPQSSHNFSVGYFTSFGQQNYEFSADLFYRSMSGLNEYNQLMTDWETGDYRTNTVLGQGRAYGLELMLKKNYGRLTGWLSYTLGRAERTFPDLNEGKTFPARYDRRHDLSLALSFAFNEQWTASLTQIYSTGSAYTLPSSWYFINNMPVKEYGAYNGARMPDYNRTDISVNSWYKKDNGLTFSIYNLFGITNPIYLFMNVKHDPETGKIKVDVKQKTLYRLIPALSWRFVF